MTRTALYRSFDASDRLLYVGISDCLSARDKKHAATSHWHHLVARTETVWLADRAAAKAAERAAIRAERPLYNLMHNKGQPGEFRMAVGMEKASLAEQLIAEMEAAASHLGIEPSTLGERAGQGGHFYARLKAGKRVWPETAAKVRDKIASMGAV